jgi:hypothetical protein
MRKTKYIRLKKQKATAPAKPEPLKFPELAKSLS